MWLRDPAAASATVRSGAVVTTAARARGVPHEAVPAVRPVHAAGFGPDRSEFDVTRPRSAPRFPLCYAARVSPPSSVRISPVT